VIPVKDGAMRQQLAGNAAEIPQAYTGHMAQPEFAPLTGYRIAVTSARRSEELCALLSRHGAEVCSAPAINMIALPDDDELHSNTDALIAQSPDILVAHTGIGFRGWVAAAEGWGLANQLIESLSSARILARGPKATGALRAAGLHEEWSPKSESSQELLKYLLESGVSGSRIAIQLHGAADPGISLEVNTVGWPVRPAGYWDRTTAIRCGQLHIGTCCSGGSGAQPRLGYRGPSASGAAHRCACDVRRPSNLSAAETKRRPNVITRTNAVGSLGPAYCRGATAAGVAHRKGRRPRCRYPRNLRAGRWFGQVVVPFRDGDIARAGAPSR
jgi:Uroporphyrinogen-III synthase HemD